MNAYERMINTIRQEGARNNPDQMRLCTMTSPTTVMYGSLELDKEDLLVNDRITTLGKGDDVLIQKISDDTFVIIAKVKEMG